MSLTNREKNAIQSGLAKSMAGLMALGGAFALMIATPAAARISFNDIEVGSIEFNDDEDLLTQIRDMDEGDIKELREEMADARDDIAEAILDIEEARRDVKEVPGGGAVLEAALSAASVIVNKTVKEALSEVRSELNEARSRLASEETLGTDEIAETEEKFDIIFAELASLEASLGDLSAAMRG